MHHVAQNARHTVNKVKRLGKTLGNCSKTDSLQRTARPRTPLTSPTAHQKRRPAVTKITDTKPTLCVRARTYEPRIRRPARVGAQLLRATHCYLGVVGIKSAKSEVEHKDESQYIWAAPHSQINNTETHSILQSFPLSMPAVSFCRWRSRAARARLCASVAGVSSRVRLGPELDSVRLWLYKGEPRSQLDVAWTTTSTRQRRRRGHTQDAQCALCGNAIHGQARNSPYHQYAKRKMTRKRAVSHTKAGHTRL